MTLADFADSAARSKASSSKERCDVVGIEVLDAASSPFPDGGLRAWLVVCGAVCTAFSTFGFVNAWGVFQAYYETNTLRDSSSSHIAWIGSLQYALIFLPAIPIGRIFDLGWFRLPFAVGSAALVISTFLIGQCTQYWHFLVTHGILVGISCGMCYGSVIGLIGNWFQKKRGLALAISTLGTSIGGTVFPILARVLIPRVGFPWTMRIIGFVICFTLGIANLTLRRRIPVKNIEGGLFNLRGFRSYPFTIYCIATLAAFLGVYTLLTFIDSSAISVGVSADFSFYLVSIANASTGIGRILTALVVDKTGAVNIIVPMTLATTLTTYLWPLAHTRNTLIAVAALYGFTSGAYVSVFPMPLYELGNIEDVGRRAGMALTFAAVGGLAGPPISGAIYTATGGFPAVGYYAGTVMLMSCSMMLVARHLVLKKFWGRF
ncbi:Riboflavin transporter MCH5 [Hypsizygus marmoreus]|uniref:Riboflavin transporter MCH5 n=1 Tax=Hypsizygus marmoreus TaxID=39966 RepID=A0A369JNU5_HYPMA|nr:Riboflavin transporter MCH5 [Hypsizygus marmoreus]